MSGGKAIAVAWLTLVVLIMTFAVWTFGNMGDCPTGEMCRRAQWLDVAIVSIGLVIWLIGLSLVFRRKKS